LVDRYQCPLFIAESKEINSLLILNRIFVLIAKRISGQTLSVLVRINQRTKRANFRRWLAFSIMVIINHLQATTKQFVSKNHINFNKCRFDKKQGITFCLPNPNTEIKTCCSLFLIEKYPQK
jgi:hypothetical protein